MVVLIFFSKWNLIPIYFQGEETKDFGKESPKSKHAEDGRWLDNMEEIQDGFTTF